MRKLSAILFNGRYVPLGWADHKYAVFDFVWGVVFRDIDITQGPDRFNTPTILMLGRYDYLTGPPELWDNIRPLFKNIRKKILEQSAHCPQYEESMLFNDTLLDWLRDISY